MPKCKVASQLCFIWLHMLCLSLCFFAVVEELWENYVNIMGVMRKYYATTICVSHEYFISIVWLLQWRHYYGEYALLLLRRALCGLCPSCLPAPGPSFATTSTSHPIPLHSAPELLTYSYKLNITSYLLLLSCLYQGGPSSYTTSASHSLSCIRTSFSLL